MRLRLIVLAGLAALAVVACGKKDKAAPAAAGAATSATAGSPLDAPYKLSGGEKVDIDALFALIPEDDRPTYESATFDAATGATVVTALRFADRNGSGGLTIDRAEFYGVHLEAIERVEAGTPPVDATFEKIFEKVRLFGLKPETSVDGSLMTIGAIELDQFSLRQGGFPKDSEKGNGARFFNAFSLGGLYFKDLVVAKAGDEAGTSGTMAVTAPDLRFVGVGGGKLDALIAKNFEYSMEQTEASRALMANAMGPAGGLFMSGPLKAFIAPDNQQSKIKSFEWRKVDFSGWLAYALKEEKPPLTAKNLINLGSLRAESIETYIGGKRAQSIGEVSLPSMEFTWLVPSKLRGASKNEVHDFSAYLPESEAEAIAILKKHGLNNVKAAGDFSIDWDSTKGGAALKSNFDSVGLADTTLSVELAGLELEKINAAMAAGEKDAVVTQGQFKGFGLKVADDNLLDALFELAAIESGQTAADMRAQAPAMVRLSGAQLAAMNPRFGEYVDAIANFLAEGGTLEIKTNPPAPVPFMTIMMTGQTAPEALPDVLGLSVTHTKKK